MNDPYLYPQTGILKNLAGIQNSEKLSQMEAEYTSLRLAELVMMNSASRFDLSALCDMHYYIFQDIFEWAGKVRIINIEKEEAVLGGISVEYSDCLDVEKAADIILNKMNIHLWKKEDLDSVGKEFSFYLSKLWKVHPFREGNTRTIVTFASQFIESKGIYIDSELFKDNASYMRSALVASSAVFSDLGDRRKPEYLEKIVTDALYRGNQMEKLVIRQIELAGLKVTEDSIRKVVFWNRKENREHDSKEIKTYLE